MIIRVPPEKIDSLISFLQTVQQDNNDNPDREPFGAVLYNSKRIESVEGTGKIYVEFSYTNGKE